ncbi:phage baseplate assembly protein V [uncultured Maribacter sp.]|uniref:type VI secretion system Vgr family protein n=1 Tax=uncultured Maribacter sp. TaxID=431308 RepID=UPI002630E021|nr:phage baseplate assembly protein V [uncultured Maribacter sp.]
MAAQSITSVYIGGTPISSFKEIVLKQDINNHHILELKCQMNVLEKVTGELASKTKNFLGEDITLEIAPKDKKDIKDKLQFFGVVTSIRNSKGYLDSNIVTITANSPTILADDGPHYHSFVDKDLNAIVKSAFSKYNSSKLSATTQAKYSNPIPYSVQHRESNWAYVSRIAMQYGEWLYYNGKNVIFGLPENQKEVVLTHNFDLKEFALNLSPTPNKFKYFTNDYITDKHHSKTTAEVNTGVNGHHSFTSGKANQLYAAETNVWINNGGGEQLKAVLDNQVEIQKKAAEQEQVILDGASDNPGVSLGKIISIQGGDTNHGQFRVTQVVHKQDYLGNYSNIFTAISTQLDVFPHTNYEATPYSDTQTAVVMENTDPEGMARIKVQFPWQKLTGETTPWIRVVTPHGGGDKGFHFIPEIGEEVLVGFEGGNAERPYMMGSLYHGKAAANGFMSDNNDIKSIRTRSGHTIELNDLDGTESITISDKNGSMINYNTQKKTITIASEEKIIIASKFISMHADDIEFHSKNTKNVSSEAFTAQSGNSSISVVPDSVMHKSAEVSIEGDETKISSTNLTANSKANTLINGAMVKLNS